MTSVRLGHNSPSVHSAKDSSALLPNEKRGLEGAAGSHRRGLPPSSGMRVGKAAVPSILAPSAGGGKRRGCDFTPSPPSSAAHRLLLTSPQFASRGGGGGGRLGFRNPQNEDYVRVGMKVETPAMSCWRPSWNLSPPPQQQPIHLPPPPTSQSHSRRSFLAAAPSAQTAALVVFDVSKADFLSGRTPPDGGVGRDLPSPHRPRPPPFLVRLHLGRRAAEETPTKTMV